MDESFGNALQRARNAAGLSQRQLAAALPIDQSRISRWESSSGETPDDPGIVDRLETTLAAGGKLRRAYLRAASHSGRTGETGCAEFDALDLARRVAVTDVGDETLTSLELAFDELATDYCSHSPASLMPRIGIQLRYVNTLLDARATLAERRRLLTVGGWLSLLAATVHIDLNSHADATAWLRTSASLARQADHPEILGWCYETDAWRILNTGDCHRALALARRAREQAPSGGSAEIQATVQIARINARLGHADATYQALDDAHVLSARKGRPVQAEHHYHFDPAKVDSFTATTLAWLGDQEAERYARQVVELFAPTGFEGVNPRARRYAAAQMDLGLIAAKTGALDEAAAAARAAIDTGQVAPSNHWRVAEVVETVTQRRLPEAAELRQAYTAMLQH